MEPEAELARLRHELAEADALIHCILTQTGWHVGVKNSPWPTGTDAATAKFNHIRRVGLRHEPEIG